MRLSIATASVGLALALTRPVVAATIYVSPSGGGNGTSSGSPTTTGTALGQVNAGDVVIFLDGTYSSGLYLTRSSNGAPITLRADDSAVPVIRGAGTSNSSGLAAGQAVSNYVVEGLWFENWGGGGIELDWDNAVSNLVIRHCVSDSNGRNGISPYRATNVTIEYSIASRNGWGPSSWSSNFNIYNVKGSNNVVRGNVAFHGIDTSSGQSDGNGFILDVTINQGSALFENNIAFLNGGSCISVTDSGGAQLVGNTCYSNSQLAASYMDEINMGNTCRGNVDGVPVNQTSYTFANLALRNNAIIPTQGSKDGINVYNTAPCAGGTSYTDQGNYIQNGAGSVFVNAAAADFRPQAGSALVDQVAHGSTFATDIGFDYKCIKTETDQSKKHGYAWWTFAPDLAYMKSIGGIKNCFAPRARPQGSNQEIGAFEHDTSAGCSSAGECDDGIACTSDSCNGTGQCVHAPMVDCCTLPADCDDANPCTTDACNAGACSSSPMTGCCQTNADCTSPSACFAGACNAGTCTTQAVPGCCGAAADCDDGNSCTETSCSLVDGICHAVTIPSCCQFDGDCADTDPCTADTCSPATRQCAHTPGACGSGSGGGMATGGSGPGAGGSSIAAGGAASGGTGSGRSPASAEPGGCACSLTGTTSRAGSTIAFLGLFGLLLRRRRRG